MRFFINMFIPITVLLFCLPMAAFAKEKSVIVGFHQKPGPSSKALIHGAKGIIKHTYHLIPAMAASISEQEIERLKKNPNVAYVEDDAIFVATDDEYMHSWGVLHIGADGAHTRDNKGAGIKVAIIDTGIDYNHEDLSNNYAGGYDFVFGDDDPFDDSFNSHGTHVAGIIAAEENGIGVIGVAPEADLYALKVLDGSGHGLASWIIAALEWAVDNGMDVANLSLEGPINLESFRSACNDAYDAGVLLVGAGGNSHGGTVQYPARYSSVIAVTATTFDDVRASFSPVGPELELAAPGVGIISTVVPTELNGWTHYALLSGTSQAAPHVAGTAALFFAINPSDENGNGMIHDEVRTLLQTTAIDLGTPGLDDEYGYGLVNATALYTCECKGDFDDDLDVDGSDAFLFKEDFGRSDCTDLTPCNGDFDCDQDVDGTNAFLFKEDFGRESCPECIVDDICNYPEE